MPSDLPVAVVGAGVSGAAAALHLRSSGLPRPVLLFERSGTFGRGLAYATSNPRHWLNVPARRMSLHEDRPDDFMHWLDRTRQDETAWLRTPLGIFATRGAYGRYVADTLRAAADDRRGGTGLDLIPAGVVDIVPCDHGFDVVDADGRTHAVAGAVLAWGHPCPVEHETGAVRSHPWGAEATAGVRPDRPVMIVGTGLSMVDAALSLNADGLRAPILALSRHGLLPRPHAGNDAVRDIAVEDGQSLLAMLRAIREQVAAAEQDHAGWQSVMEGLRPLTQGLWLALSDTDRTRFLRHLRPWWDVHRHRMAQPAAERIDTMIGAGALRIERGRIVDIDDQGDRAVVTWHRRGEAGHTTQTFQRVIDATGVDREERSPNALRNRLDRRGLTRPGPLGMGIDVTRDLSVVGTDGAAHARLWALGPITRGVFWESVAVPEIRAQSAQLARSIEKRLLC